MILRNAVLADAAAIACLVRETVCSVYPRYYPDAVVDAFLQLHDFDAISADVAKGKVVVAAVAGEIVGTGAFDGKHISRIFVSAEFQGRGIGSSLLDRLEEEGRIPAVCFLEAWWIQVHSYAFQRSSVGSTAPRSDAASSTVQSIASAMRGAQSSIMSSIVVS